MKQRCIRLPCCVALALAALSCGRAHAQLLDQFLPPDIGGRGIEPGVTVTSRTRPEFDSTGIRAGSFMIRPEIAESAGYESNVLGTSSARGSALVRTNAVVEAQSDISRVDIRAALRVDDTRYLDLPKQSFTNWSAAVSGSYEIGRDLVSAGYTHLNLNQTVRDLDVPQLDQAIMYQIDAVRLSYRASFNRVFVLPSVDLSKYSYGGGTVAGGTYSQDYRDRTVVTPGLVVGYEFSPRRSAVVLFRNSIASYDRVSPGMPKRDYNDAALLAGLDYDVDGIIRFRILGGYEIRTFDSAAYKTIQAPVVEGSVAWSPTGLTTVTGTVGRRIQDSADESTAGFTETSARLRVDHEYLRNVLLQANAGVYYGEYSRGGGNQTLYVAGTGAEYLLNRNLRLSLTYDFASRTSNGGASNTNGAGVGSGGTGVLAGSLGTGTLGTTGQAFGSGYTDHRILLQVKFRL